jgi:hypothetical protein
MSLQANVRKVGAIGIFYPWWFDVDAKDMATAKSEWFAKYGSEWELHHFVQLMDND